MIWFKFNGTECGISSTQYVRWDKRSHMGQINKWYLELKQERDAKRSNGRTPKDPKKGSKRSIIETTKRSHVEILYNVVLFRNCHLVP